jgi:hypothetical protein
MLLDVVGDVEGGEFEPPLLVRELPPEASRAQFGIEARKRLVERASVISPSE